MTGGTSGFGAVAADRITRADGPRLLLGARRAREEGEAVPLDLARLGSVREFAAATRERLGDERIDALVLNAGVIRPSVEERTVDGFETTFAVNHLAHYLVLRLLLPLLADGAVVVLTTSGAHDPATGAGLAPPRHADARLLAFPERDPGRDVRPRRAGQHAYTASKLCTVLTVRALSEVDDLRSRGVRAVAFDPGQVFGTGLVQGLPLRLRAAWAVLGTPVGTPLRWFDPALNTRDAAGLALSALALRHVAPPPGRSYAALRRGRLTWPYPSEAARDEELSRRLWDDSARLVGLRTDVDGRVSP
ncbi:SDR family NAD(P)-dependent oxidoreductase [Cellulosimicrobium sp. PMB13]|uniref:SDR family NAD(P)-dependent oxidoreductase n=1 Tax=Cellulosimicrobium sp. PMB13 TaxID=3120158 RepID=UPI003F4B0DB3